MRPAFYDSPSYRKKQSEITRKLWVNGTYNVLIKTKNRVCKNPNCTKIFQVKPHDKNKFCTHRCAALVNNPGRVVSIETRIKLSQAMKGIMSPHKGVRKVQYITLVCQNGSCNKRFELPPWLAKRQKFCSNLCHMKIMGGQTTSPKASKGKPGVRLDIDPDICFYSTWEANIARVFNFVGIEWVYAPTIFKLDKNTYRPDFYLPESDTYIEVKNFMNEFSHNRDRLFRKYYFHLKLDLILKKDYLEIKENYKPFIDHWE